MKLIPITLLSGAKQYIMVHNILDVMPCGKGLYEHGTMPPHTFIRSNCDKTDGWRVKETCEEIAIKINGV